MSESSADLGETMPIMDHLRELRSRLIRCALAIAVGMMVLLATYNPVKDFLTKPYRDLCAERPDFNCDGSLFSLGPLDGFSARIRICAYGGLVLALPVIMWQIWRFVVPALSKKRAYLCSSVHCFIIGFVFNRLLPRVLDSRQGP